MDELPEPFTAEELTASYQSIPAADLEPVQFPTDAPMLGIDGNAAHEPMVTRNQEYAKTTPSSPAPATDTVSVHCAKREKNNNQPKDNGIDSQTEGSVQEDSQQPPPADSQNQEGSTTKDSQQTPQTATTDSQQNTGDDLLGGAVSAASDGSGRSFILHALAREGEGRAACWERLRKESRAAGMVRGQGPGSAYEWATREVERLFPPKLPLPEPIAEESSAIDLPEAEPVEAVEAPEMSTAVDKPAPPSSDALTFTIPATWGVLPANTSLQVEISWVSANRLLVRDGSGVDLSRALSPAPSYSALSWLETSVLFPSKFADISVKATQQNQDEKEHIRREKLAIDEIRGLLAEMLEEAP